MFFAFSSKRIRTLRRISGSSSSFRFGFRYEPETVIDSLTDSGCSCPALSQQAARKAVFADEARLLLTFRDSSCEDREFGQRIGFGENLAYSLFL